MQNHCVLGSISRRIRIYDGTNYLVLFRPEKYDAIYNRIRYLISQKTGISHKTENRKVISHNYEKIKIDS